MNIKPLADRVLILPAPAEEKTIGGIIIPDTAKEKPDLDKKFEDTQVWLQTGELSRITSSKYKTHNKAHIQKRIEYVKQELLK